MPDTSLHQSLGAVPIPAPSTGEKTLASLDPARDVLMNLFKEAINAEATARWNTARVGMLLADRAPVEFWHPDEPEPELLQEIKTKMPALFVYRGREPVTLDEYTILQDQRATTFHVDYILSPLSAGDRRKMLDVLQFVETVLDRTIANGGHRAYSTTVNANGFSRAKNVLVGPDSDCKFNTVVTGQSLKGPAAFSSDGPSYYALSFQFTATELATDAGVSFDEVPYHGTTATLGTGNSEGLIKDLLQAKTSG